MRGLFFTFVLAIILVGGWLVISSNNKQSTPASANPPSVQGEERHIYGQVNAPVTVTVFSDFQCPYCQIVAPILEQNIDESNGKVKLIFRHFPIPGHQYAQKASEAAEAAGAQDPAKFWKMHDLMFVNQDNLAMTDLVEYAGQIGLDVDRFKLELESGQYEALVQKDFNDGEKLNIQGTPTVFIGDQQANYRTFDELKSQIKEAAGS